MLHYLKMVFLSDSTIKLLGNSLMLLSRHKTFLIHHTYASGCMDLFRHYLRPFDFSSSFFHFFVLIGSSSSSSSCWGFRLLHLSTFFHYLRHLPFVLLLLCFMTCLVIVLKAENMLVRIGYTYCRSCLRLGSGALLGILILFLADGSRQAGGRSSHLHPRHKKPRRCLLC